MSGLLPNPEFLAGWQSGKIQNAILEIELALIDARLRTIQHAFAHLIDEKIKVTGGDDWHDGAFRATDAAANHLSEQQRPLVLAKTEWPQVEMPEASSAIASIGSRVEIIQNDRFSYVVDLVGMVVLHDYGNDDDLMVTSINSPLGKALVGQNTGTDFSTVLGEHTHQLRILGTSPSPALAIEDIQP